jgi:hypothetical protein
MRSIVTPWNYFRVESFTVYLRKILRADNAMASQILNNFGSVGDLAIPLWAGPLISKL